jgi:hypothetical protein
MEDVMNNRVKKLAVFAGIFGLAFYALGNPVWATSEIQLTVNCPMGGNTYAASGDGAIGQFWGPEQDCNIVVTSCDAFPYSTTVRVRVYMTSGPPRLQKSITVYIDGRGPITLNAPGTYGELVVPITVSGGEPATIPVHLSSHDWVSSNFRIEARLDLR